MNEKAPDFDQISKVETNQEAMRIVQPRDGQVDAQIAQAYQEWHDNNEELPLLPVNERLDVIKQWFLDHGVEMDDEQAAIEKSKFPLKQIALELKKQGLNPFDFIRWCAGPEIGISELAQTAEKQGLDPLERYVNTDANLEFGYNLYPEVGEPSIDGDHVIEANENLVSPREQIHKHINAQETYVVFAGGTTLRIHINQATKDSNAVDPERKYQMDGEDIVLDLTQPISEDELNEFEEKGIRAFVVDGKVKALSYAPPVNDFHTVTHVTPGADFLVIKSPSKLWDKNSGEPWNDKYMHPAETVS